ncbi:pantoate--beta-alanine ligase [Actinopolymorpha sp. B11F2]|uniref:pantoate--beta-alanine ligase n=1 Tax=Actinopolymorpha sp. B11F2 TaxID=3160862 RepID=UPI0032E4F165
MRELERDRDARALARASSEFGRIVVIGNGRVGGSVVHAARSAGLEVGVAGRDRLHEAAAAEIVLICVPDRAIPDLARALAAAIQAGSTQTEASQPGAGPPTCAQPASTAQPAPRRPAYVGHVSGASGLDVLAAVGGVQAFSLHPLQTIPRAEADLTGVPCAVAGATEAAAAVAEDLARRLGMRPFAVAEEHRALYHAAAVMASNFLVTLEEAAADLLARAGVADARATLAPLVRQTAANWSESGGAALTGPVARGDNTTVARHVEALQAHAPDLRPLYDLLTTHTRALADRAPAPTAGRLGGLRPDSAGGTQMSTPRIIRTREELRTALASARREGHTIGLVPTMGALHEGHLTLLRTARARCDVVVMSLFVNPTQFAAGEDLAGYPRNEERDVRLAGEAGADVVYAPDAAHVYPDGYATTVEVGGGLTEVLCGAPGRRGPGHFRGVTTVVAKLLNAVGPDVAFFGQKDAQQAVVIRRMVRDLEFGVQIVVVPTVREPDGLAMSSRNVYLDPAERTRALALNRALTAIRDLALAGERATEPALALGRKILADAGVEPEYLEARDAEDLTAAAKFGVRPVLVAVAARVGRARLIDNTVITLSETTTTSSTTDTGPNEAED